MAGVLEHPGEQHAKVRLIIDSKNCGHGSPMPCAAPPTASRRPLLNTVFSCGSRRFKSAECPPTGDKPPRSGILAIAHARITNLSRGSVAAMHAEPLRPLRHARK